MSVDHTSLSNTSEESGLSTAEVETFIVTLTSPGGTDGGWVGGGGGACAHVGDGQERSQKSQRKSLFVARSTLTSSSRGTRGMMRARRAGSL